ncbi:MAG: hypothetical protein JWQ43_1349 [Glaciihabitans sp.]|nr:hypothetical protein [Glaciihabitans sp.]
MHQATGEFNSHLYTRRMDRSRNCVVFDLGEVLASPPGLFADLGRVIDVVPDAVEASYWKFRDDHDRGNSASTFWTMVLDNLSVPASAEMIERLSEMDSLAWTDIRPSAELILEELHAAGTRIGILSNAPFALAGVARTRTWAQYISEWYFSGELLVAKPDQEIFRLAAGGLNTAPDMVTFFDDRVVNVEAARAAGWDAELWVNDEDTRRQLVERGFLQGLPIRS